MTKIKRAWLLERSGLWVSLVSYQSICILTRNTLCHKATPTTVDTTMTPSMEKLSDLTLIEKRLDNWFLKQSQTSTQFTGNVKKRWDSLQVDVNDALTKFASLNVAKSTSSNIITGEKRLNQKISIKNLLSTNMVNILNRMRSLNRNLWKILSYIHLQRFSNVLRLKLS